MDAVGIEASNRNDFLDLGKSQLAARGGRGIEVASGLAKHKIAALVRLPALDDREVRADAAFEDIFFAIELFDLLPFGDLSSIARLCVEAGNSCSPSTHALCERPLRAEFDLELARQKLPLELLVFADVGRDHLPDLPGP